MSTAAEPLVSAASHRSQEQFDRQSTDGPESGLVVAIGRALGTVVVTVRGQLTAPDAPRLSAILDDLINNQGNLDVVVDLRRLSETDPSGLAVLAAAADWAARRGAGFRTSWASAPFEKAPKPPA